MKKGKLRRTSTGMREKKNKENDMNKIKSKAETMMKKKAFMRTALYNGRNQKHLTKTKRRKKNSNRKKWKNYRRP